jgi:hypothetical protein
MTTLDDITKGVTTVVDVLAPVASVAFPQAAVAIAIGSKIIQGVIAAEPTAIALFNQIKGGTPPTPAQLAQFSADYETAYQKLNADIAAKLAALPPGK